MSRAEEGKKVRPAAWPSCITLNVQGFLCLLHHEKCGADMSRALCTQLPSTLPSLGHGHHLLLCGAPSLWLQCTRVFFHSATMPHQKSSTLATKFPLKLVSYPHIVVGFEPSDGRTARAMVQTRCAPQGPWVDGTRERERKYTGGTPWSDLLRETQELRVLDFGLTTWK